MTLREKQSMFVLNVARLIVWAYQRGYELTFGETIRSKEEAKANSLSGIGIINSLHIIGLAIDLNLFINDEWKKDTESFKPLGAYWKTLDPLNRWGGDFHNPDANHFSMEHGGVK